MPSASFAGASAVTAPLSAPAERRNLSFRILSGVGLGPPVLALAYYGGPPHGGRVFDLVTAAAAAVALREWLRMTAGRPVVWFYGALAAVLVAYWSLGAVASLVAAFLLATGLAGWTRRAGGANPLLAASGLVYLVFTVVAVCWLRDSGNEGWRPVLFLLLVVWASDIGAFAAGRSLGGPRLAPRISPNKTWAGLMGALFLAALTGAAWSLATRAGSPVGAALLAAFLGLVGQAGDLLESAMKRRFKVKDSGGLIPGHGGLLDRIDALLAVAPVFALLYALGGAEGVTP